MSDYEIGYFACLAGQADDGKNSEQWLAGYARAYEEGER